MASKLHRRIDMLGKAIALISEIPGGKDSKSSVGHVEYQNQSKKALALANRIYWFLCEENETEAMDTFNELSALVAAIKERNSLFV